MIMLTMYVVAGIASGFVAGYYSSRHIDFRQLLRQPERVEEGEADPPSGDEEAAPLLSEGEAQGQTQKVPLLQPASSETAEIIDLLRSDFLDASDFISRELNEENLAEVIASLGAKARLSTAPFPVEPDYRAIKCERLPSGIAYWRISSFDLPGIALLAEKWSVWKEQGVHGLIIDLRDFQAINDYEGAVQLAGLLLSPGTEVFSIQGIKFPQRVYQSDRQPIAFDESIPVIVLVNINSRGPAEVLAGAFRSLIGAVIVGNPTPGEAGLYSETKLRSGRYLRRATAEAMTASGEKLMNQPVQPDVLIPVGIDYEDEILAIGYEKGVAGLIRELPLIPRANEAALVKKQDVELDRIIDSQLNPGRKTSSRLSHDIVLHRAVDVIRGIRALLGGEGGES